MAPYLDVNDDDLKDFDDQPADSLFTMEVD
jgi:hypothetical protein